MTPAARTVLRLARIEAARSTRHVYTIAALLGAAALAVAAGRAAPPRWWTADSTLGVLLLLPAAAALVTAHLAVGRPRRDGLDALYRSFPTPTPRRRLAHLLAVLGPTAAAAGLGALVAVWFTVRGATGTPSPAVLAGAALLVLAGGAAGVALGTWLPHAAAGLLAVVLLGAAEALVVLNFESVPLVPARWALAMPWARPAVLSDLPVAVPDLMRPAAHAVELAGLVALAVTVTMARRRRPWTVLVAGLLAVTVVATAAWWQSRPVPLSQFAAAVHAAADPAGAERCVDRTDGVRYCAYPRSTDELDRRRPVVDGVLAHVPVRPSGLVVRQVSTVDFLVDSPVLTAGHDADSVNALHRELADSLFRPADHPAQEVYVPLSGPTDLEVALAVARWAVGLPGTAPDADGSPTWCVPDHQAREVVALWLAAMATPATRAAFDHVAASGLLSAVDTAHGPIAEITLVSGAESAALVNVTGVAARLAAAIADLPVDRVARVLADGWSRWRDPTTTSDALAAALGLPMPQVAPPSPPSAEQGVVLGDPIIRPTCG